MFIYIVVLVLLLFAVFHYDLGNEKFSKNLYAFIVYVTMTLMTGLRYRVGGDSLMYEDYYSYLPNLTEYYYFLKRDNLYIGYQPLYVLFVAVCKSINPDYYFYQFIHSLVFNTIVFRFIFKNTAKPFSVLLLLFVFCLYFYFSFDIQRESLAICCFLLGYKYFVKKSYLIYYIYVVLGFLFHISAIFLFILPLLKLFKISRKLIYITILFSIPIILLKPFIISVLDVFLFTDSMKEKGKAYSEMEFSLGGTLFFYFGRVLLALPFILFYTRNKDKLLFKEKEWLFLLFLFSSVFSQVMIGSERFLNYIYIPFIIVFVNFAYSKDCYLFIFSKKNIYFSVVGLLFFIINIKIVLDLNVDNRAKYGSVFFPYNSVLDKKENPDRENFMIELWKRN